MQKEKEILPSTCRIGKGNLTSMAVIGGRLFSNHHKNMKNIHKDSKDLVSIIITLGKDTSGGKTMFYDGVKNLTWELEIMF